ncbi:helix-turn-helix domain-containing protein [Streptomyces sp. AC495_CC817]|uniref:helix-turn-helix domain-containing protein n=1 Tax=Streptomyces sp. AC495_CC817 TaxID=2823900 RepID=UPI0035A94970
MRALSGTSPHPGGSGQRAGYDKTPGRPRVSFCRPYRALFKRLRPDLRHPRTTEVVGRTSPVWRRFSACPPTYPAHSIATTRSRRLRRHHASLHRGRDSQNTRCRVRRRPQLNPQPPPREQRRRTLQPPSAEQRARLAREYEVGATIAELVTKYGHSYGATRRALKEGGAQMRPSGGR